MELHSIDIEHYKNLRNCHVDFSGCGRLAVLAGVNGSGKSNFLEFLALAFRQLVATGVNLPQMSNFRLCVNAGGEDYDSDNKEKCVAFDKSKCRMIVVYSGEFNRLSQLGFDRDKYNYYPEKNVVFITSDSYQLLMLTDVIMRRREGENDERARLVDYPEVCKLSFTLVAMQYDSNDEPGNETEAILLRFYQEARNRALTVFEMSIDGFEEIIREVISDWDSLDGAMVYFILKQLFDESTFCVSMENPILNLRAGENDSFDSTELSEGEKWLIMYDVIYNRLTDANTLVVLDEPDDYIHEIKKRNFIRFVQTYCKKSVQTVMATHSPSIINSVPEDSLFAFSKCDDGYARISRASDLPFATALLEDRMNYFSDRPILLLEGISDLRLVSSAREFFVRNFQEYEEVRERLDFDLFSMGGADNMIDAYKSFHKAFPSRRIYVALDHDKKGEDVLSQLVRDCGLLDVTNSSLHDLHKDAVFLLPRPNHVDSNERSYVIEDYLPKEFIQEKMDKYVNEATRFSKVTNCLESIKTEIRTKSDRFTEREWLGFKPLIDFLIGLTH